MSLSEKTAEYISTPPLLLLPQDIVVEILSKLPVKSLVQFRCVSKFFCTLIADHGFGVLYRSLSLTLPSRAGILIAFKRQKWFCDDPPAPPFYTINFSEENPRRPGMLQANRLGYLDSEPFLTGCLRSSSDGLICLSRPSGDVTVCNVSTGHRIYLPRIKFHSPRPFSPCAVLGFDSQSKRYKVLMSVCRKDPACKKDLTQIQSLEYKHWILTVGVDKSWREINYSSHPFYPFEGYTHPGFCDPSVYIDGIIYSYNWLTTRDDPHSFHIVAFEVGSESYSLIPIPVEVPSSSHFHSIGAFGEKYYYSTLVHDYFALLQVDGGQLAIVYVWRMGRLNVWTWEKCKECWEKISMRIPPKEGKYLRCTTNHAGEIVLLCTNSTELSILVCNLKSNVWRKFDVGGVEEELPIDFSRDVRMYKTMDNVFSME
ncbi:PREDICTED: putative F-box protein At3g52320 [Ipomoea nil]|uniref:putative F-box protein At3g52320 n=1 Tax=Ipomoea nil TaxID=35883 RepID=UPI0009016DED|nr:PREDICTED: putative F-box protein At3g52320 [Ipomoea nil]XP_019166678.1 PREDICTED: putative F-box protein At3g52320 [Ipomoea nil]